MRNVNYIKFIWTWVIKKNWPGQFPETRLLFLDKSNQLERWYYCPLSNYKKNAKCCTFIKDLRGLFNHGY